MIDRLEELLSITAAGKVDEGQDREEVVLSLDGVAVNTTPSRQVDAEGETKPIPPQGQGFVFARAADDESRTENDGAEQIVSGRIGTAEQDIVWPKSAPEERRIDGMEEPSEALSQLIREIGTAEIIPIRGESAEGPQRMISNNGGSGEIAGQQGLETGSAVGLQTLYREVAQGTSLLLQAVAGQAPGTAMASELHQSAGDRLTVDGLDRAVRRDSRRYDGGMTLF